MVTFDESGEVVESPDMEAGYVVTECMEVTHVWVIDSPEEGEIVIVAEYPNGGKDAEWRVTKPEEGHWETRDGSGEVVEHFDGTIPEDLPHDVPNPDVWQFQRYVTYTEEQLAEIEAAKKQAEIDAIKAKLEETDYVVVKMAEAATCGYSLSDDESERYAAIIEQRRAWRDEINSLEGGGE